MGDFGVIVTGANGRLGASAVTHFCRRGARVFGHVMSGAWDTACADGWQGNLDSMDRAGDLFAKAGDTLGQIDAVVHCVGNFVYRPLEQLSLDEWRSSFAANVDTAFAVVRAYASAKARAPQASAVLISSVHATAADPNLVSHCASKAALDALVRGSGLAFAAKGLRVNAVAPGAMVAATEDTPTPNPGEAIHHHEVCHLAWWLCSAGSQGITGSVFPAYAPLMHAPLGAKNQN